MMRQLKRMGALLFALSLALGLSLPPLPLPAAAFPMWRPAAGTPSPWPTSAVTA